VDKQWVRCIGYYYTMSYERLAAKAADLRSINEQSPAGDFHDAIPYQYYGVDMFFQGRYGDLARSLAKAFRAKAATSEDPRLINLATERNVHLGFCVLCQTLSFAPDAYDIYTRQRSKERSVEQLSDILRRSGWPLVTHFASVSSALSKIRQVEFGIYDHNPSNPYKVVDGDSGAEIIPSPEAVGRADMTALRAMINGWLHEEDAVDKSRRCPALGRVLFSYWNEAIDVCASNPALFAADLGLPAHDAEREVGQLV
jgi:hypothetical protein